MSASHGVIAAGHDITAQAGAEILRAGGNAYDAALGALAAACVAEPVLASMAGGGFMLASPKDSKPVIYDFFVQTPSRKKPIEDIDFHAIMADFGNTQQEFHIGMASAAVPGQIAGMFEIHKDLCSMPMKDILQPAINAARRGVIINDFQAFLFTVVEAIFLTGPDLNAIFASQREDGKLALAGERVKQPALADFLEILALEGPDLFYRGEIASQIDRDMNNGGLLTRQDLESYRTVKRPPLTLKYRDILVEMNAPPSAGGTLVALGLKLLEDHPIGDLTPGSEDHLMHLAAALKQTLEARVALQACNEHERAQRVLDEGFLAQYKSGILGRPKAPRGTTHLSVIDKDGNMAGVTVSNGEGGHYIVPGAGVIMNNMMGEEDLNPGGFHKWTPNVRMSSMMNPTALLWPDGRRASFGSGGSNRIRTTILQLIINLIDFGLSAQDAVALPRIHMEEDQLYIEGGFEQELSTLCEAYPAHTRFEERNLFFGGTHLTSHDKNGFHGAGDPRRAGVCLTL